MCGRSLEGSRGRGKDKGQKSGREEGRREREKEEREDREQKRSEGKIDEKRGKTGKEGSTEKHFCSYFNDILSLLQIRRVVVLYLHHVEEMLVQSTRLRHLQEVVREGYSRCTCGVNGT